MNDTDTTPDDTPTCGKGIAASADLPAKLAELLATRAEVLERHTKALDLTDPASRQERDGYENVVRAHRTVVDGLTELARLMSDSRDLPMGEHDMEVMMDPNGQMEAFQRFVKIERELVELLQAKLEEEEAMLAES